MWSMLNLLGMNTEAKSSHAADYACGLGWESKPVMISNCFAVCVLWVACLTCVARGFKVYKVYKDKAFSQEV
eukprot:1143318-Pelagomonas_calceolata.AAC.1